MHPLLIRMGRIPRMERGKLCRMTGRPHYNHQTWKDGHNVARYVSADQVESLQEAIDGYCHFMELAQQYAELIIQRTRNERPRKSARQQKSKRQK